MPSQLRSVHSPRPILLHGPITFETIDFTLLVRSRLSLVPLILESSEVLILIQGWCYVLIERHQIYRGLRTLCTSGLLLVICKPISVMFHPFDFDILSQSLATNSWWFTQTIIMSEKASLSLQFWMNSNQLRMRPDGGYQPSAPKAKGKKHCIWDLQRSLLISLLLHSILPSSGLSKFGFILFW